MERFLICRGDVSRRGHFRHARAAAIATAASATVFASFSLAASTTTWNNAAGHTDYNTTANWTSLSPANNDATFDNAAVANPNVSSNITSNSIVFGANASGYDITASPNVTLSLARVVSGIAINATNTSGTNTIDAPIALLGTSAQSQQFTQAGGGTLVLNGAISTPNAVSAITLNGTATITLGGANTFNTVVNASSGTINLNNANALGATGATGAFVLPTTSTTVLDNTSGTAITLKSNNAITLNSFSYSTAAGTANNNLTFGNGTLSLTGPRTITINGSGSLAFGGSLTQVNSTTKASYPLTINNGVSNSSAFGTFTLGGYVLANPYAAAGVTGVINGSANVKISGAISDGVFSSGFTYSGTGVLTRTGADTYTGATAISASGGAMFVNGTHTGAGAYSVSSGATLGGSGSIATNNAAITFSSGSKLSPGQDVNSAGTLTVDTGTKSLDISAAVSSGSGSMLFDLGSSSDQVLMTDTASSLAIGSGKLDFSDFAFTTKAGFGNGTYVLFDTANAISGTLSGSLTGAIDATHTGTLTFADPVGDGVHYRDIVLTVVPEPTSLSILGLTAIGLLRRRR